jgi:hypothetical protein
VDTTGFGYYDKGISQACLALAKRFWPRPKVSGLTKANTTLEPMTAGPHPNQRPRTVNILGATPLDLSTNSNLGDLRLLLESNGLKVNACFPMAANFNEFLHAPQAGLNLVVSRAGLRLAKQMRNWYGMPYVAGLTMGTQGRQNLLDALDRALLRDESLIMNVEEDLAPDGSEILIIGEAVQANALRAAIRQHDGDVSVTVATIFGREPSLVLPGDLDLRTERQIRAAMHDGYRTIVADPQFRQLLSKNSDARFVEFPIIAVSSRLSWDICPVFLSEQTQALIESL